MKHVIQSAAGSDPAETSTNNTAESPTPNPVENSANNTAENKPKGVLASAEDQQEVQKIIRLNMDAEMDAPLILADVLAKPNHPFDYTLPAAADDVKRSAFYVRKLTMECRRLVALHVGKGADRRIGSRMKGGMIQVWFANPAMLEKEFTATS
jgi:hypothetical protein